MDNQSSPEGSMQLRYEEIKSKIKGGEFKIIMKSGKSKAWDVYGDIEDSAGNIIKGLVACRKCFNINKAVNSRSSNLLRHKCVTTSDGVSEGTPYTEVEPATKKKGVVVFAKWVVRNCRPFNIVEDKGLIEIAEFFVSVGAKHGHNVDIKNLIPHRTTITRNIHSVYGPQFEKVKCEINLVKNIGFGLTSDIWTDNILRKSYIAVTIHYILNGALFSRLLGMRSMEGARCTHDIIEKKVSDLLEEFNCEFNNKVIMVTDRGQNMIAAFKEKNRINCVDHLLHNTMQKSLQEVDEVAKLCSISTKLVKYFKVSGQNTMLKSTLKSFSPTRWNTMFYVFTSIAKNWGEINTVLQEKNQLYRIDEMNIILLNDIIKLLEPFEETFKKLEGQTYPTIHLTVLYIDTLLDTCSVLTEDLPVIKQLKETFTKYLKSIVMPHLSIYHKLASFLFPSTNKLLNFNEAEKNNVHEKCMDLMRNYLTENSCNTAEDAPEQLSTFERKLMRRYVQPSTYNPEEKIKKEMQTYVNLDITFLREAELIQWWENRKIELPLLYIVSCRILSVPATSAASERVFSVAGYVLSEKRSTLGLNDIITNEIMFLHSNLDEEEFASKFENVEITQ